MAERCETPGLDTKIRRISRRRKQSKVVGGSCVPVFCGDVADAGLIAARLTDRLQDSDLPGASPFVHLPRQFQVKTFWTGSAPTVMLG
jgi:hypothetical protein